jgi:hypothetical protein
MMGKDKKQPNNKAPRHHLFEKKDGMFVRKPSQEGLPPLPPEQSTVEENIARWNESQRRRPKISLTKKSKEG